VKGSRRLSPSDRVLPGSTHPGSGPAVSDHAVQFYDSDEYLCDVVAEYALDGVTARQPVLIVATPEHRAGIAARLTRLGVSPLLEPGIVMRDARETLEQFMTGPLLDDARCRSVLSALLRAASAERPEAQVRVFGEIVDLLWRDGHPVAALRLEEIWNELTEQHAFTLLCGYAMANFTRDTHARPFADICARHARVFPTEGYARMSEDARAREVSRLQQRERVLEAELEQRRGLESVLREMLAERRRTEDELRAAVAEAERSSRAKSEFLAVMSHELRTPLNAIFGYEDLLTHHVGGALTEQQHEYLTRLRGSADQLLQLVNQVLHLSRIEAGQDVVAVEDVDLAVLAAEAVAAVTPAASKKRLALDIVGPESLAAHTDGGKFRQILLNLLSNAVKFTAEGGVTVALRADAAHVVVEVIDSGIGIAPDDLERIFEPFVQADNSTTRQYGGTGLGLAVSRNLARLLGGELSVESRPGAGSTFRVRLPLA
jgi:signal transduction histidine kinase